MTQHQQQPYDSALKSLLGDEVAEILPKLLPDSEYIDEQNIEVDRTTLKADLVYNIKYRGKPSILNMELQTDVYSIASNERSQRFLTLTGDRGDEAKVYKITISPSSYTL